MKNIIVSDLINHLKRVKKHRKLVHKFGKYLGIGKYTLFHDLSSYSKVEMNEKLCTNFGLSFPHDISDIATYNLAWINHISKNKHHLEHWIYINDVGNFPIELPFVYAVEFLCDSIASQIDTHGELFTFNDLNNWWKHVIISFPYIHANTYRFINNFMNFVNDYFSTIPILQLDKQCWDLIKSRLVAFYKL